MGGIVSETRRNGTTANNNKKILNEKNGVEGTAVGGGKVRVEGIDGSSVEDEKMRKEPGYRPLKSNGTCLVPKIESCR